MKKRTKYILAGIALLTTFYVGFQIVKKKKDQKAQGSQLNDEAQQLIEKINKAKK